MKTERIIVLLIVIVVLSGLAVLCRTIINPARTVVETPYEDGTYRGIFADGDKIQVNVQFTLKDGVVTHASFRHLRRDGNYYLGTDEEPYRFVVTQYEEALAHLVGKNLRTHLSDLYYPENVVTTEVDTYTSATIRSNKIISAVRDALNRGVYSF